MHSEQILTAMPPAPVQTLEELYAIAVEIAERASRRYGDLAARTDDDFGPVRDVFEALTTRERDRVASLTAACVKARNRRPAAADLRWSPADLVPREEVADIGDSKLSTPYSAWALAVRHRQRAFLFWTYVVALAEDPKVRTAAEGLAKEALWDGNLLRRERRLAWSKERHVDAPSEGQQREAAESAARLESLLVKDIIAWSQKLPSAQRARLLGLDPFHPREMAMAKIEGDDAASRATELEPIRRRALKRAEQLSNIYLADADHAVDQPSMELAQELAARSIMRLAGLRHMASADRGA